jgi:hypothetical protein
VSYKSSVARGKKRSLVVAPQSVVVVLVVLVVALESRVFSSLSGALVRLRELGLHPEPVREGYPTVSVRVRVLREGWS